MFIYNLFEGGLKNNLTFLIILIKFVIIRSNPIFQLNSNKLQFKYNKILYT